MSERNEFTPRGVPLVDGIVEPERPMVLSLNSPDKSIARYSYARMAGGDDDYSRAIEAGFGPPGKPRELGSVILESFEGGTANGAHSYKDLKSLTAYRANFNKAPHNN